MIDINEGNQLAAAPQDSNVKPHWLWGNWILLAMLASISFVICNFFIGKISDMGPQSVYYFCSGSLLFSILYFVSKREWSRLNKIQSVGMLDAANAH